MDDRHVYRKLRTIYRYTSTKCEISMSASRQELRDTMVTLEVKQPIDSNSIRLKQQVDDQHRYLFKTTDQHGV